MWRDVTIKGLKGLFYEWVDSGSISDVGGEGAINDSDKHSVG